MAPIRLGVIGLSAHGWASTNLIPPIFDPLLSTKYILTAICTSSETSAQASAEKYSTLAGLPVKAYFGKDGPTRIANDPNVDMVAVSVKMPDHYAAIMPAIEAGKDIFIEWTPGKNLEETIKIAEAAKAKGVRALVGAQGIHGVAINKAKELIDSGEIGRVLSTSLSSSIPSGAPIWGNIAQLRTKYLYDINNGATPLSVPIGHFLVVLKHVLGELAEVSASTALHYPTVALVDEKGNLTGETLQTTVPNDLIIHGVLKGKHEGVLINIHQQSGAPSAAERFRWTIVGEKGVIELSPPQGKEDYSSFIVTQEKDLYLNGELVKLEYQELDKLTSTGKAWLEFAKGKDGKYTDLEVAVEIYRVLDAVVTSSKNGKKISLAQG